MSRRASRGEAGFTLIEVLMATLLMTVILAALATVTAQWLPNWNRGIARVQRAERLAMGLDRMAADLSVAEMMPVNADAKGLRILRVAKQPARHHARLQRGIGERVVRNVGNGVDGPLVDRALHRRAGGLDRSLVGGNRDRLHRRFNLQHDVELYRLRRRQRQIDGAVFGETRIRLFHVDVVHAGLKIRDGEVARGIGDRGRRYMRLLVDDGNRRPRDRSPRVVCHSSYDGS